MHGEEGQVHTYQHQPEMYLSKSLVQQFTRHLGEPVIDACEDTEYASTEEHIMEVRNHEIGISHLVVKGDNRQSCAIETANQKHGYKA